MSLTVVASKDPLAELERRQEDVLAQLDALDQRIELALREFAAIQKDTADRFGHRQKAAA